MKSLMVSELKNHLRSSSVKMRFTAGLHLPGRLLGVAGICGSACINPATGLPVCICVERGSGESAHGAAVGVMVSACTAAVAVLGMSWPGRASWGKWLPVSGNLVHGALLGGGGMLVLVTPCLLDVGCGGLIAQGAAVRDWTGADVAPALCGEPEEDGVLLLEPS